MSSASSLATFAAGCFWSVELVFQREFGVKSTEVGYTGGSNSSAPTYREVCSGSTGHAEAVRIEFDPSEVSYTRLLEIFWQKHDPTTLDRQGNDVGSQYRSAIFYHSADQKSLAESSLAAEQKKYSSPIVTQIVEAPKWWPAEEYHQKYLEKGGQCASKGCKDKISCYGN